MTRLSFAVCVLQEVKSYPVQWIKVVEKLDEGVFHRKHMFQVVIVPSRPAMIPNTPSQITLYLQAAVSVCVCACVCVCVCVCMCVCMCVQDVRVQICVCVWGGGQ